MLFAPIRGEAGWLIAFKDIADEIRRKEGEINHLLHAALRCLFCLRNLIEGLAQLHLFEPAVCFRDVADQLIVLPRGKVGEDELGLDAALSDLKHGADVKRLFVQCVSINVEQVRHPRLIQPDTELTRFNHNLTCKVQNMLLSGLAQPITYCCLG